ncbi:hypothetical protein PoB_001516000 [Plakobranchus ocellatus]|uniref:Uncharacterized protein n=1 Tax=Plakobranchus ocellatus TaxID=259542 RepID=A0AAV3YZQ4_9GAST|nr:hypothetical protein PoB_001516000 [Plakobranchus ocellatus]
MVRLRRGSIVSDRVKLLSAAGFPDNQPAPTGLVCFRCFSCGAEMLFIYCPILFTGCVMARMRQQFCCSSFPRLAPQLKDECATCCVIGNPFRDGGDKELNNREIMLRKLSLLFE